MLLTNAGPSMVKVVPVESSFAAGFKDLIDYHAHTQWRVWRLIRDSMRGAACI